jgi:hypothetical protein
MSQRPSTIGMTVVVTPSTNRSGPYLSLLKSPTAGKAKDFLADDGAIAISLTEPDTPFAQQGLSGTSPDTATFCGTFIAFPPKGGLHHRYETARCVNCWE